MPDSNRRRPYDPAMPYADRADQQRCAKAHYEANKEIYRERARIHRKGQRAAVDRAIRTAKARPCADCNVQYPYYVMHFDHVAGEKLFNLGNARMSMAVGRVVAEMEKCEVVCANCHAERTHRRGQRLGVVATDNPDRLTLF